MSTLSNATLSVCHKDTAPMSPEQTREYLRELPEWTLETHQGTNQLSRTYPFKNFVEAMDFAHRVGMLAEQADHHPEITIEWGKARVRWWTHSIGGLHDNDFIMAARCDQEKEADSAPET